MPAVSEMPVAEVQQHDPDLLRACSMTGSIRWLEIYRAYLLAERLDKAAPEDQQEIIEAWGKAMGITPGTLASHLRWARLIQLDDLVAAFSEEGIGESEWTARVGTSHLKAIGRAKEQGTSWTMELTSRERAAWVRRAYHANLSVAELEDMLRDHDLLPPKRNLKSKPLEKGKVTACTLLEALSAHLKGEGLDFELDIPAEALLKPMKAHKALWRLAQLVWTRCPGMEFRISEEAKP